MGNPKTAVAWNEDPWSILGLTPGASEEEIRAAYLCRVKEHPPDRSPVEFERIRDAHEILRDPRRRIELALLSDDPEAPFVSLMDRVRPARRFVGPAPWLSALREI